MDVVISIPHLIVEVTNVIDQVEEDFKIPRWLLALIDHQSLIKLIQEPSILLSTTSDSKPKTETIKSSYTLLTLESLRKPLQLMLESTPELKLLNQSLITFKKFLLFSLHMEELYLAW